MCYFGNLFFFLPNCNKIRFLTNMKAACELSPYFQCRSSIFANYSLSFASKTEPNRSEKRVFMKGFQLKKGILFQDLVFDVRDDHSVLKRSCICSFTSKSQESQMEMKNLQKLRYESPPETRNISLGFFSCAN